MAYFAEIDSDGTVLRVIVADQAFIDSGAVGDPKNWIETDYDGKIRKNYAGIGYTYDRGKDAFISPKPHPSWSLDENGKWKAPKTMPPYSPTKGIAQWSEENQDWVFPKL